MTDIVHKTKKYLVLFGSFSCTGKFLQEVKLDNQLRKGMSYRVFVNKKERRKFFEFQTKRKL